MTETRIVVVDDHTMLRQGVVSFLASLDGISVVGEAADGNAAVSETRRLQPDLLITDLQLPGLHGLRVITEVLRLQVPPKIVVVSMHSQPHFVKQAFGAGAHGYVLKEGAVQELKAAIDAALAGERYTSPSLKRQLSTSSTSGELSDREQQVLRLIALGKSTRDAAEYLHLSPKTIESHRKNIMDKLELRSVAELTNYCIRMGLIDG